MQDDNLLQLTVAQRRAIAERLGYWVERSIIGRNEYVIAELRQSADDVGWLWEHLLQPDGFLYTRLQADLKLFDTYRALWWWVKTYHPEADISVWDLDFLSKMANLE